MEETTEKLKEEEISDPKLKELVEKFDKLSQEFFDVGYIIQPFIEQGVRIVKIQKESPILKGFRGYQNPNKKKW